MNTKNIQNLIFGTSHVYLMFLFCVGLVHAQRVDVVDHLGNKTQIGTLVTEADHDPIVGSTIYVATTPKQGDIWIDTSKTPNTTNIWDGDAWKEVKPSYQVMSQDADTDTKIQLEETTDEDTIRFDTGGEERMVITDEGNVGIGTSSPSHFFTIAADDPDIGQEMPSTSSANLIQHMFTVDGVHKADIAYDKTSGSEHFRLRTEKYMTFETGGSAERMRIDASGNVGIGTISPTEKLDVAGNINTSNGLLINNNKTISWIEVTPTYTEWSFEGPSNQTISLNPSSIPESARYVLADVFATAALIDTVLSDGTEVSQGDHQHFILGRDVYDNVINWVSSPGNKPSTRFNNSGGHKVILSYSGEKDGFSSYFGQWYSSQVIPTQGRDIDFANPGNSQSDGWIYIIVRAYSL